MGARIWKTGGKYVRITAVSNQDSEILGGEAFGGKASEAVDELRTQLRTKGLNVFIEKVLKAMSLEKNRSTRQTYRSSLRQWAKFCSEAQIDFMPPTHGGIVAWMEDQADRGLKAATILLRVKVVSMVSRLLNYDDPRDGEGVMGRKRMSRILRDVRKVRPAGGARALTVEEVRRMVDCSHGHQSTRNRAALALCFLGGLRCSELIGLRKRDIDTGTDAVRVYLRASKGDRGLAGDSVYAKDIPGVLDLSLLMRKWLRRRERLEQMKGWRRFKGGESLFGMNAESFSGVLRKCAKAAKVSRLGLSTHSLRAGCATEAALAGVSMGVVQRHLRHKEIKTTMRYFRPAEKERVADTISAGIGARAA